MPVSKSTVSYQLQWSTDLMYVSMVAGQFHSDAHTNLSFCNTWNTTTNIKHTMLSMLPHDTHTIHIVHYKFSHCLAHNLWHNLHCKLPQRGPGWIPSRKWIVAKFKLKNPSDDKDFSNFWGDHYGRRPHVVRTSEAAFQPEALCTCIPCLQVNPASALSF